MDYSRNFVVFKIFLLIHLVKTVSVLSKGEKNFGLPKVITRRESAVSSLPACSRDIPDTDDYCQPLKNPSLSLFKYFDGRGNIRAGDATYSLKDGGRTLVVDCSFPSSSKIASKIVWFRKRWPKYKIRAEKCWNCSQFRTRIVKVEKPIGSRIGRIRGGSLDLYDERSRVKIKKIGNNRSQLILYNFDESDDAGVYRCFARRFIPVCKSRCGISYSNFESVFLETEVDPKSSRYFRY